MIVGDQNWVVHCGLVIQSVIEIAKEPNSRQKHLVLSSQSGCSGSYPVPHHSVISSSSYRVVFNERQEDTMQLILVVAVLRIGCRKSECHAPPVPRSESEKSLGSGLAPL